MRLSFFWKSMLYLAALVILFIVIISPTAVVFNQQAETADRNVPQFTTLQDSTEDALLLLVKLTSIDYTSSTYKAHITLGPYIADPDSTNITLKFFDANYFPKVPINLFFKDTTYSYVAGKPIPAYDITTGFSTGDSAYYPFDVWTDVVYIEAWPTASNSSDVVFIPLYIQFTGNMPITEINTAWSTYSIDGVQLQLTVGRSVTTKGFSLFVVILMWMLSLATIGVAYEIVVGGREVVPPNMAAAAALLFAIVNVRNAQPGVPPVGILIDICGYFWNVALIAISSIMITVMWVYRWSPKPAVKPEVKKNVEPGAAPVNDKSTIVEVFPSKP